MLDDIPAIVENLHVRSLVPLTRAMDAPAQTTVSGRPVVSLTLALDHAIAGGGNVPLPGAFHRTNLLIHILAGLTLFGIARRTLPDRGVTPAVSLAVLWLLHPLHTSSVTYIVQRAEALMGLFFLLTLYCAIRGWTLAAIAACALGMGSKEVMASAPFVVVAWDWFFGRGSEDGFRAVWARRWPLYAGLAATWLILAWNVWSETRPGSVGFGFAAWPWWRYLLTQAGVILHYLRLAVWPSPLVLDYAWPPVASIVTALPALLLITTLLVLTIVATVRRDRAGFAGIVFFLVLAPTSSVLPIVTEVAAEHRMYVPLAAVLAVIVVGALHVAARARIPSAVVLAGVACVASLLGWMTYERNADYASEERIWADTIEKRPENPRARTNYGVVLLAQGRTSEAEPHLRAAVRLDPDEEDAHVALGAALCSTARCDEGLPHLQRAAEIDPNDPNAIRNLAEAHASRGQRREAARYFRRAVGLTPDHVFTLNQASWLLATAPEDDVRDGPAALAIAERAVALTARRDPVSLDSLAVAYAELGRFGEARAAIREAIAAAQQYGPAGMEEELRTHLTIIDAGSPVR